MRFSIRDGPGIRTTVFLKGCRLRCRWCHNPEGIAPEPEIIYRQRRCQACGTCIRSCPQEAICLAAGRIVRSASRCRLCGACADACPTQAVERIGRVRTVSEVIEEVAKDRPFYEESGGGVTISGGEPLCQPDFLAALLRACKEEAIHTVLDTSGAGPLEVITRIRRDVDLFLYDLKLIDDDRHRREVGHSNREVLENLRALAEWGHEVVVRVPIVPGCNDDEENIRAIGAFLTGLASPAAVELLGYHDAGEGKYLLLGGGEEVVSVEPPSRERLREIAGILRTYDLKVDAGA
jgi:pyruvate formate lyase activating enzyme